MSIGMNYVKRQLKVHFFTNLLQYYTSMAMLTLSALLTTQVYPLLMSTAGQEKEGQPNVTI